MVCLPTNYDIVLCISIPVMCVSVSFSKLREHAFPYCFSCWYIQKDCLQTNYGNILKFAAVLSFMCNNFWLVHGTLYISMHLPLFFDVVCTNMHCLQQNLIIMMMSSPRPTKIIMMMLSMPLV